MKLMEGTHILNLTECRKDEMILMNNKLMILGGVIIFIGIIILKYLNLYFINNILTKKSQKEQDKYNEMEIILSKKGAFNVPFKNARLISKENSRNDFYNFGIIISIILIIIGFMYKV